MANIVNWNAICAIITCHSIYYSIILTFNGNYQKLKILINWFLNITEAFFENRRMEGYMQTCVIFHRKLPNPEVSYFFWIQKHWAFKKIQWEFVPMTGTNWLNFGCWLIDYNGLKSLLKWLSTANISERQRGFEGNSFFSFLKLESLRWPVKEPTSTIRVP